jgi:RNA polymerase sigma-70 factor (ECF subfamily)
VYGIAWHGVRSFDDAQDVAQEALVKAFRTLSQLADPNRFGAWLHAITRNECRMWRRSRRDLAPIQGDAVLAQTARDEWARHEARSEVIRAVASLPDDSRLVVSLRYLSGLSCDEISATLGVPLTTVEGRLSRARRKLREEMMAMAQETLAENKLPEEFADKVLRELSVTPGGHMR